MVRKGKAVEIKIAYIGGGSRYWAKTVLTDLALCRHITGEIALYDIDYQSARKNAQLADTIFSHRDARTTFRTYACRTRAQALKGADFIFLSILPGPITMFVNDLDIPRKYGILQTVGDTTGPGGISRALRTVPIYLDYAHKIMKYCPRAWAINYTNPMTLCTAALYAAEPKIRAFGCCHEVFGTQMHLAELVKKYFRVPLPRRQEIKTDVAGVNHFTFVVGVKWRGRNLFPLLHRHMQRKGFWRDRTAWAKREKAKKLYFGSQKLIAFDFLRRFGVLGAAGDRHLAEFVPWHLVSEANLHRYGVVLTPSGYRLARYASLAPGVMAKWVGEKTDDRLRPSDEEGVVQMMALLGIKPLDTNVNLPNVGQMPELPRGAVVETNARFRKDNIKPIKPESLPDSVLSLVRRAVDVQQMTLKAAIRRDKDLAFQALLNDPLCRIPVDRAWKMFCELLKANKAMLPGWK